MAKVYAYGSHATQASRFLCKLPPCVLKDLTQEVLLGASWVVIHGGGGVISRVSILMSHIRGLIAPLLAATS